MSENDLHKSLNDFMNRPIHKELSLEILATIPDENIEQAIIDYIDTKIYDFNQQLDIVARMSASFQMMYSTWILEGEVNNGGFNQFFVNPSRQFAEMALKSLKLIGATEYYKILQKAIDIHSREKNDPVLQELYSQNTRAAFSESYQHTALSECDEEFYKLNDFLGKLRILYIRSNPVQFVGR